MPGIDELAAQLSQLSNDYYGDRRAKRESDFMSKYGSKFGNDRGLGLAILEELDSRGIDTSAADEAVQGIVDELRSEIDQLRSLLGDVEEKTEAIKDAVDSAVAGNPDSSKDAEGAAPEMPAEPPAEPPAEGGEPAPEMPAEGGEAPAEPAPEEPAPEAPAEGGEAPAEPPAEGAGSELPPEVEQMKEDDTTVSDARLKKLKDYKTILSDVRMKRVKKPEDNNCFKPSASMIEIAQRGY